MAPDTFHWWMDLDDLDLMYESNKSGKHPLPWSRNMHSGVESANLNRP